MIWAISFILIAWAIARFHLEGEDLNRFNNPTGDSFSTGHILNDEHIAIIQQLNDTARMIKKAPRRERLPLLRKHMDNMFNERDYNCTFLQVDINGVPAEWVLAPEAESSRRLLYIHGGSFTMGSPRSHRTITTKFSQIARAAVLSIDYRLMPEYKRQAGIDDCRAAYLWLLENGPHGAGSPSRLFVSGDSAGGNLALSLIAWVRDQDYRVPDAAVVLSPLTDGTLSSPSIKNNLTTDAMLGPMLGALMKIPRTILLWFIWFRARMHPAAPCISPVHGNLANLPPTLVHASKAEGLFDDAKRYVNKAAQAGSPVKLQSWSHVVHVWHMFEPELTEARQAFDEIQMFLAPYETPSSEES